MNIFSIFGNMIIQKDIMDDIEERFKALNKSINTTKYEISILTNLLERDNDIESLNLTNELKLINCALKSITEMFSIIREDI